MTPNMHHPNTESHHQAEETLRLVATLPPPIGLEDRVHHRLETTQFDLLEQSPRSFWSLWMPVRRLQFAGAAALVLALAASSWSVYHTKNGAVVIQPAPQTASPTTPTGNFGSAGAERHPSTLTPIKVPPAPKKKPTTTHSGTKPSPKKLANPSRAATEPQQ
jgi:hypothetical protein